MKRTLPLIRIFPCLAAVLITASLLAGGACKKKPVPVPTRHKAAAPRVPTSNFTLNYAKGKKQNCELMTRYDIITADEKLKGKTLLPLHAAHMMNWDISQDKNTSIKMTWNTTTVDAVNTEKKAAAEDIVGALNTQPAEVTLDVSASGMLNSAQGLEEHLAALAEQAGKDRLKTNIAGLLRRQMSFESLNNITSLMFSLVPADAKTFHKEGDTWGGKEFSFSLFGTTDAVSMPIKFKFSALDAKDKNLAYILFGGEKQFAPGDMQAVEALAGLLDIGSKDTFQVTSIKIKGYIVYNLKELDIEEIKQEITLNTVLTTKKEETEVGFVQTSVLNLM